MRKHLQISNITADDSTFDDYATSDYALCFTHSSPKRNLEGGNNSALLLKDPFPNESFKGDISKSSGSTQVQIDESPVIHDIMWSNNIMQESQMPYQPDATEETSNSGALIIDESSIKEVNEIVQENAVESNDNSLGPKNEKSIEINEDDGNTVSHVLSSSYHSKLLLNISKESTVETNAYDAVISKDVSNMHVVTIDAHTLGIDAKDKSDDCEISAYKSRKHRRSRLAVQMQRKRARIAGTVLRRINARDLFIRRNKFLKNVKAVNHTRNEVPKFNRRYRNEPLQISMNATRCSHSKRMDHRNKKSKSTIRVSTYLMKKNPRKLASFWKRERNMDGYNFRKRSPSAFTCSKHGMRKPSELCMEKF